MASNVAPSDSYVEGPTGFTTQPIFVGKLQRSVAELHELFDKLLLKYGQARNQIQQIEQDQSWRKVGKCEVFVRAYDEDLWLWEVHFPGGRIERGDSFTEADAEFAVLKAMAHLLV